VAHARFGALYRQGMRITYVGHATVLIEVGGLRILTDPVLRSRLGHLRRYGMVPSPQTTESIDAVLVSHLHADHLDRASLRLITSTPAVLGPRGAGALLSWPGSGTLHELAAGESVDLVPTDPFDEGPDSVHITATAALHDGRRPPFGPSAEAIGFEIRSPAGRIYFAGDTDIFAGMDRIAGSEDDPLDVALLPIWGWGPRLGPGHMDPIGAAEAVKLLRPRLVIPIHWGTLFPIGLGSIASRHLREPPRRFAAQVAERIPETEVAVLEPGASIAVTKSA
jgi:L-ascorbate metabolism protein UlaG (beta-lactamase superfamily)